MYTTRDPLLPASPAVDSPKRSLFLRGRKTPPSLPFAPQLCRPHPSSLRLLATHPHSSRASLVENGAFSLEERCAQHRVAPPRRRDHRCRRHRGRERGRVRGRGYCRPQAPGKSCVPLLSCFWRVCARVCGGVNQLSRWALASLAMGLLLLAHGPRSNGEQAHKGGGRAEQQPRRVRVHSQVLEAPHASCQFFSVLGLQRSHLARDGWFKYGIHPRSHRREAMRPTRDTAGNGRAVTHREMEAMFFRRLLCIHCRRCLEEHGLSHW